jgi:hypothetical protein
LRFEEDSRIGVCEDCGEKVKISEKDYDWIMNEWFGAESGQMCEVCFGKDDLPYNSDNFTECRRCGKSVCMDCDGEMQYHPDWFKVCGECSDVLDNVHDYGAESKNKNTKMVIGITALGIGLAFWKGKDLLSLWDRIKEKME